MTSNDLKTTKTNKKNNNILKARSADENIENNDQYLDEVLHKNDIWTLISVNIASYSYSHTSTMIMICKIVFVQLYHLKHIQLKEYSY